ncbi:ketosteroid isomerase [Sphaerisporangium krabiense]|uniref:Ketosteroid isomerase-like protein n=1 Tax=Sphaerisporangium krabiense TaxID=763782 RepID=A0A7W9DSW8_9ACTN|nr:nuclear transport factor 2 family protein [Sphaerisporangium krabiense]MBB5629559.1 ketosteroid isomerase-like protein [Sphaerisporangium krabiense]GII67215.1 ketosteroid isomerase [Sphaerisporangium krabiense]
MSTALDVVQGFYTAAQAADGAALARLLHPDFEARTAPGMPCGAGGAFHGPQEALIRVWGAVYGDFDTAPYAETWEQTTDGTVVVTGHYRGTARATGRGYEAEFVHLWRVADGKLSRLHQYTDTARWHQALAPAPGGG